MRDQPYAIVSFAGFDLRDRIGVSHQTGKPPAGQVVALANGLLTNGVSGLAQAQASRSKTSLPVGVEIHHDGSFGCNDKHLSELRLRDLGLDG